MSRFNEALAKAIQANDFSVVSKKLFKLAKTRTKKGRIKPIDYSNPNDGNSYLQLAVSNFNGDTRIINKILKYKPNLLNQNKGGLSALGIAAYFGKNEAVTIILDHIKHNPQLLREVIMQMSQNRSILYIAVYFGKNEAVTIILDHIKHYPQLLRDVVMQRSQNESPLYLAANLGKNEAVTIILDHIKHEPQLLREVIMQMSNNISPLFAATNLGRNEVITIILDHIKHDPQLLREVIMQMSQNRSPLYIAANLGMNEAVTIILDSIKHEPQLLREAVMQMSNNMSPLYAAVNQGRNEAVAIILDSIKHDPQLLRDVVMQRSSNLSPLYMAAHLGSNEAVTIILDHIKHDPQLLRDVVMQPLPIPYDNKEARHISILDLLIMNNDPNIFKILYNSGISLEYKGIEAHPFYSDFDVSHFYFNTLNKLLGNAQAYSIFRIAGKKRTEIRSDELGHKDLFYIVSNKKDGNQFLSLRATQNLSSLKHSFENENLIAEAIETAKEFNINRIVISLSTQRHLYFDHEITILLTNNKGKWVINIHDPNINTSNSYSNLIIGLVKELTTGIDGEVQYKMLKSHLPNIHGHCDEINSIMSAVFLLGLEEEFYTQVTKNNIDMISLIEKIRPGMNDVVRESAANSLALYGTNYELVSDDQPESALISEYQSEDKPQPSKYREERAGNFGDKFSPSFMKGVQTGVPVELIKEPFEESNFGLGLERKFYNQITNNSAANSLALYDNMVNGYEVIDNAAVAPSKQDPNIGTGDQIAIVNLNTSESPCYYGNTPSNLGDLVHWLTTTRTNYEPVSEDQPQYALIPKCQNGRAENFGDKFAVSFEKGLKTGVITGVAEGLCEKLNFDEVDVRVITSGILYATLPPPVAATMAAINLTNTYLKPQIPEEIEKMQSAETVFSLLFSDYTTVVGHMAGAWSGKQIVATARNIVPSTIEDLNPFNAKAQIKQRFNPVAQTL